MPAPLAKGLIIAASVLVAAGIAIYESPQVRQWVEQSRRKIAIALHSLGDDIHPRRASESSDDFEERKRRRDELIRRNRNELVRRAREEGVAVDLDELARIGREEVEMAEQRVKQEDRKSSAKSFDDLVGSDGMLKATGSNVADRPVRRRGMVGPAAMANPFADEMLLFDMDTDEAPSPKEFTYTEPSPPVTSAQSPLVDLTPESDPPSSEIPHSAPVVADPEIADLEQAAQSFYSFSSATSSNSSTHFTSATAPLIDHNDEDDLLALSAGTLTPRSHHSQTSTTMSLVGSHADDIADLSLLDDDVRRDGAQQVHDDHDDARSEAFSEGGFTEEGFSEAGFSETEGHNGTGVMTPSGWTDVGSDDESEWGGPASNGHVSQVPIQK